MPDELIDRILDAAYACFARHGARRTTMDDIAAAAEMSRPAVYQYVRNKDDVFRRLGSRLFEGALATATAAATRDASLADRLHDALAAKLELTLKLYRDSPHAAELLDESARMSGALVEQFRQAIHALLSAAVADADSRGEIHLDGTAPADVADLALALLHGLEADLTDPERPRRGLRLGTTLLSAGLARAG
jgi:TetR/AcrR family transcriptional regulator